MTIAEMEKRWPSGYDKPFLIECGYTFFRRGFVAAADNMDLVDVCLAWPQSPDMPRRFFYSVVGDNLADEYRPGDHFDVSGVLITIDTPADEIERYIRQAEARLIRFVKSALTREDHAERARLL
jgi:hypothetical protein